MKIINNIGINKFWKADETEKSFAYCSFTVSVLGFRIFKEKACKNRFETNIARSIAFQMSKTNSELENVRQYHWSLTMTITNEKIFAIQ